MAKATNVIVRRTTTVRRVSIGVPKSTTSPQWF